MVCKLWGITSLSSCGKCIELHYFHFLKSITHKCSYILTDRNFIVLASIYLLISQRNSINSICFVFSRNERSFICNYKEHWFTVRKLGKQVIFLLLSCPLITVYTPFRTKMQVTGVFRLKPRVLCTLPEPGLSSTDEKMDILREDNQFFKKKKKHTGYITCIKILYLKYGTCVYH